LKLAFHANILVMSVMPETSHVLMSGLHAPVGERVMQFDTALLRAVVAENTHAFGAHTHTDPCEPANAATFNTEILFLHAAEQSTSFSAVFANISFIAVAATGFHADRSWLNALAPENI
jgi:hypothetical protein